MRVVFHKNFQKKFQKLPPKIKTSFYSRLRVFTIFPFDQSLNNHSVENVYPECRSINITGDYRAIYTQEKDAAIFVIIGTHSQLYK